VIEFIIEGENGGYISSFAYEVNAKIEDLTFRHLVDVYTTNETKRSYQGGVQRSKAPKSLPNPRAIDCYYRNTKGRLIPVSGEFPHDTDNGWRRFFLARFWLVPVKEKSYSFFHMMRRYEQMWSGNG